MALQCFICCRSMILSSTDLKAAPASNQNVDWVNCRHVNVSVATGGGAVRKLSRVEPRHNRPACVMPDPLKVVRHLRDDRRAAALFKWPPYNI